MLTYYARFIGEGDQVRWQRLREHLLMVARLAAAFAREANPGDRGFVRAARRAGLLHDLGKYGDAFQQRLRDAEAGRPAAAAPHARFGAALLDRDGRWDQALAVLGHHAGLHAASDFTNKVRPEDGDTGDTLLRRALDDGLRLAGRDGPVTIREGTTDRLALELRERMLFSCLVDADRSDCVRFEVGMLPTGPALDAQKLLSKLLGFIAEKARECPPGVVKECRAAVLDACLDSASLPGRLLTLAVPTGGGKTLSGMAFALKRATLRPDAVRRVVVVVPYLSIIEQNAAEYRAALGDDAILEHHSGDFASLRTVRREHDERMFSENEGDEAYAVADEDEDAHLGGLRVPDLARENWDAPVIVTTSVRFFETIFSNRPSDLRRLHNIARSVVILDEVQTLPRHLLAPLLSVMQGLAHDWGVHFVFSTATQPAFERPETAPPEDIRWAPGSLTPIIPSELYARLVRDLQRVAEPVWASSGESWSVARQAEAVRNEPRALCILNTKRQVRDLFQCLRSEADGWLVHLSTRMCAAHRLAVIRRIQEHLRQTDEPCRVISSQLVEAGVDLSFPAVMRAMGPLDAIVQAAGRCDRDGRLTAALGAPAGRLTIFEPEDGASPYPGPTSITRSMLGHLGMSLHAPAVMRRYFNELYEGELDGPGIQGLRLKFDFPAVAEAFSLIDDRTRAVLVPYGKGTGIIACLERGESPSRDLLRLAGRYQVGLYPNEFHEAERLGAIYSLDSDGRLWACRKSCYDDELGLDLRPPAAGEHVV
ncbi:CRISPR-associated HD domain protein [Alkalidesulfovibrio alkalitolerans DSM 16529]|uniref:CRISPR-associated HD domain protein n=1 Tax=Alkalidesulfovibrio alkalitolerans DSM 16529 TaxID=1121439 RepID=S7TAH7_9BACT|nr:CRISPR-associated endonuclease Cas3'' [Alkalidesulfovibrio alkalitolerans]EPR34127.1 CRISPR-associated HD domain protein [Alkalidesulfovibrio alkalitolerans DSM 16529]